MKLRIGIIVFCATLYAAESDRDPSAGEGTVNSSVKGMLQILVGKLETMEYRLQKMESMQLRLKKIEDMIQEHQSTQMQIVAALKEHRSNQERSQKEIFAVLHKLENRVMLNLIEVQLHKPATDNDKVHNTTSQIMNAVPQVHQNTETNIQEKQESETFTVDYNSVVTPTEVSVTEPQTTTKITTPKAKQMVDGCSCKNISSGSVSGTYLIHVKNDSEPFEVYCEQNSFGGGWIVFQYRYNGSLDFYRGWNEYRDGFGDLNQEFWLGLEKIHQITSDRKHEFAIQLKDFSGTYKYARYDAFQIGSESEQYVLKELGNYRGTADDAIYFYDKGMKFSTKDRDNDENSSRHCAQDREGAWWHWDCAVANLNGRYMNARDTKSMFWFSFNEFHGLSYSRMMIRELK